MPPVLLVWGIIAFAIGFIAYAAQGLMGVSGSGRWDGAWVALTVSLLMLIVVALGLYIFTRMWSTKRNRDQKVVRTRRPTA